MHVLMEFINGNEECESSMTEFLHDSFLEIVKFKLMSSFKKTCVKILCVIQLSEN